MIATRTVELAADCRDSVAVWQTFLTVVGTLGVTVCGTLRHDFPGGGFSGLILIAESHAAIHTWPELGRLWCELATCGDPSACDRFEQGMRNQFDG